MQNLPSFTKYITPTKIYSFRLSNSLCPDLRVSFTTCIFENNQYMLFSQSFLSLNYAFWMCLQYRTCTLESGSYCFPQQQGKRKETWYLTVFFLTNKWMEKEILMFLLITNTNFLLKRNSDIVISQVKRSITDFLAHFFFNTASVYKFQIHIRT